MSVGILDNDGGVYYNSYGKSPATSWDGSAFCVDPSGDIFVDNDVDYFYGRKSPVTDYSNYACLVIPSGDVYNGYDYVGIVNLSYGYLSFVM